MTDQQASPTKPAPAKPAPAAAPKRSLGKMFPLVVLILAIAAFFIWRGYFANPKVPDNIVVLSGLAPGAAVITDNLQKLREGSPVSPHDAPPAPAATSPAGGN